MFRRIFDSILNRLGGTIATVEQKEEDIEEEEELVVQFNLLQLPNVVIRYIIQQIDLDIERICLHATCHRLFDLRRSLISHVVVGTTPTAATTSTTASTTANADCLYLATNDFNLISLGDRDYYFNSLPRLVLTKIISSCDLTVFKSLRYLYIEGIADQIDISEIRLPPSLIALTIGDGSYYSNNFSRPSKTIPHGWLPEGLRKLQFRGMAPPVIVDMYSTLPVSLKTLEGCFTPQPLPNHLEHLYCHSTFKLNIIVADNNAQQDDDDGQLPPPPPSQSRLKKVFLKYYDQDTIDQLPSISSSSLEILNIKLFSSSSSTISIPFNQLPNLRHIGIPQIFNSIANAATESTRHYHHNNKHFFSQLPNNSNLQTVGIYNPIIPWYDFYLELPLSSARNKRNVISFEKALLASNRLGVLRQCRHSKTILQIRLFDKKKQVYVLIISKYDSTITATFTFQSSSISDILRKHCVPYCGHGNR
ncbi:hypothetical protein DFA_00527 [Cavenderia fasciculata]|uniref:F-box domain-containing protein n=1 Tax=Cavenderia fasciculata TaxID=261658 RepID=F4PSC0_CACFS|nr:uncharacterized protein DFA_00527 [Cavenderia fasciculata]EGG20666.1 hypothetical protein DFA_00527 [Cavenderia fasciculata]|eukprot:XP_004358516.1 hypothetical protein DFA_00527 [Cavenderia fasciculata]